MTEEDTVLITHCDCSDPAHSMEFRLLRQVDEEPELYISVQLNQRHPWWRRIRYALGYVLGRRSQYGYGHWDEGQISRESAQQLESLLGDYLREYNKGGTPQ